MGDRVCLCAVAQVGQFDIAVVILGFPKLWAKQLVYVGSLFKTLAITLVDRL